jgi:hypothetical protein
VRDGAKKTARKEGAKGRRENGAGNGGAKKRCEKTTRKKRQGRCEKTVRKEGAVKKTPSEKTPRNDDAKKRHGAKRRETP